MQNIERKQWAQTWRTVSTYAKESWADAIVALSHTASVRKSLLDRCSTNYQSTFSRTDTVRGNGNVNKSTCPMVLWPV